MVNLSSLFLICDFDSLVFYSAFLLLKNAPFRYSINGLTPGLISPIKVTTSKRVREPGNYMKRQGGPLLKTRHAVIAGKSLNKNSQSTKKGENCKNRVTLGSAEREGRDGAIVLRLLRRRKQETETRRREIGL
jgi:hypothetical protein